jgi:hypothetical protein
MDFLKIDIKEWEKLPFTNPKIVLTEEQKEEVKKMINDFGGPIQTIQHILSTLDSNNRELIISKIDRVLYLKSPDPHKVIEVLFPYKIKLNYGLG